MTEATLVAIAIAIAIAIAVMLNIFSNMRQHCFALCPFFSQLLSGLSGTDSAK